MKKIKLSRGLFATVDDDQYEKLNAFKWSALKGRYTYYAVRTQHNLKKTILMHRQIMEAAKGTLIDHKNGNGLDNTKENLRFASYAENQHNRRNEPYGKSKYRGIVGREKIKAWQAKIGAKGKYYHLGYFKEEKEAALAFDKGALKYHGEFAVLNFTKEKKDV